MVASDKTLLSLIHEDSTPMTFPIIMGGENEWIVIFLDNLMPMIASKWELSRNKTLAGI